MTNDKDKKKRSAEENLAILVAQAKADEALEQIESASHEQIVKELTDAGVDLDAQDKKMRALLEQHGVVFTEQAPGEAAEEGKSEGKVVPLRAPARRPFGVTTAWLVAAALALLLVGTTTAGIAYRDELFPSPIVAKTPRACIPPNDDVDLEGTLMHSDAGYALELATPLCGRGPGDDVHTVPIDTPPGSSDLASLVGHRVRVEGGTHVMARRLVPIGP
jgi:hypothetical protein